MGIPGPKTKNLDVEKRFSDDILKIELSGPDHRHLSVVDVPGLFHSEETLLYFDDLTNLDTRSNQVSNRRGSCHYPEINRGLYD